jgi:hypothetical protein
LEKGSLAAKKHNSSNYSYLQSKLFHSPPQIDLKNDDDNVDEYMYPEDSPELFTPMQSNSAQDQWSKRDQPGINSFSIHQPWSITNPAI